MAIFNFNLNTNWAIKYFLILNYFNFINSILYYFEYNFLNLDCCIFVTSLNCYFLENYFDLKENFMSYF